MSYFDKFLAVLWFFGICGTVCVGMVLVILGPIMLGNMMHRETNKDPIWWVVLIYVVEVLLAAALIAYFVRPA